MKRRLLRISILACIALAIFLWAGRDRQAPRYAPGKPAAIPPIEREGYDFLADVPFANDRMWIWTDSASREPHVYLYDLRQQKLLGQLFNADVPVLCSQDGSRLLVKGFESTGSFEHSLLASFLKLFGIRLPPPSLRTERFWIMDTSRNSVKRVGSLWQLTGSGSRWHPSPDFRYGYTEPTTSMLTALYLCDLEQPSLKRISIPGYPRGWWDEHDILFDMGKNQFDLLDIRTGTTRSLFSDADFEKLLANAAITNNPPVLGTDANWNGRSFDFYFGINDQINGMQGTNSFVLRASADSPQLALLYPAFQFRWAGHFDRAGKRYLFPGENGQPLSGGNGAVYLRDLTSGAVSTIVSPENRGSYSIPRFYGNEVIYIHDHRLHRIGLNGSNDALVLSP